MVCKPIFVIVVNKYKSTFKYHYSLKKNSMYEASLAKHVKRFLTKPLLNTSNQVVRFILIVVCTIRLSNNTGIFDIFVGDGYYSWLYVAIKSIFFDVHGNLLQINKSVKFVNQKNYRYISLSYLSKTRVLKIYFWAKPSGKFLVFPKKLLPKTWRNKIKNNQTTRSRIPSQM